MRRITHDPLWWYNCELHMVVGADESTPLFWRKYFSVVYDLGKDKWTQFKLSYN